MTPKAFEILRADRGGIGTTSWEKFQIGETVYESCLYDYGCAQDDTRVFGIEHISITKSPDGKGIFYTIPRQDLKEIIP